MRAACVLSLILVATCSVAQEKTDRYGVALDAKAYPQATAKEALSSLLKAVADKKVDYVVAHLADPSFVDDRVKRIYGGKFAEQVEDTRGRLDPFVLKQLKRFLDEGKWSEGKVEATVTLDDSKERQVKLVKKGDRWYLANAWAK
jgi:PhoPQ-activated pathogenicity-related protein